MASVKLKGWSGKEWTYDNVPKVWLNASESTEENEVKVPFTYGEAVKKEVSLDFSDGDMQVPIAEGELVTELTVKQPDDLIPENIPLGMYIAGVGPGTFEGGDSGGLVIPKDMKPIKFYDPFGELLYAYTLEEAAALTALPPGPTISGLNFDRWTHTLAEIQSTKYFADVGPMYKYGSSPATVLIVETIRANTSIAVCLDMWVSSYKATIYWGDGSSSSLTGSSSTNSNNRSTSHTYASIGIHYIAIVITSGLANLGCIQNSYSYNVLNNTTSSYTTSDSYMNGTTSFYLRSVLVGSYYTGSYPVCSTFLGLNSRLRFVSLYNAKARGVGTKQYVHCASLKCIAGNTPLGALGAYSFFAAASLEKVSTNGVINANAFEGATALREVIYGSGRINASRMNVQWAMLMTTETPPVIGATSPIWGTKPIYVPDSAVATYQSADKWSTAAAYIRPMSQYHEDIYSDLKGE